MFYYVKNLQGDIVKILDEDGQEKANYVYNAWGNILSQSEDELSSINPLRYRGYVYDEDTAMYYLQTRYYDPTTGRFINADDTVFISSSGTAIGDNIYTYCENDPVNNVDYTGQWFHNLTAYRDYYKKRCKGHAWRSFLIKYNNVKERYNFNKKTCGSYRNYILGQGLNPVSNMVYGASRRLISKVGCELIAVYNALKWLGYYQSFSQVILEAEMNDLPWLNGRFGTDPKDLYLYFKAHNIKYKKYKKLDEFRKKMRHSKVGIISQWNKKYINGLHTFFIFRKKGKYYAYNYYNDSRKEEEIDLYKIDSKKFIIGYCFI